MRLDPANLLPTLIHEQLTILDEIERTTAIMVIEKNYRKSLLALLAIVELCNENTDHRLVDKSWILEAIEREFR